MNIINQVLTNPLTFLRMVKGTTEMLHLVSYRHTFIQKVVEKSTQVVMFDPNFARFDFDYILCKSNYCSAFIHHVEGYVNARNFAYLFMVPFENCSITLYRSHICGRPPCPLVAETSPIVFMTALRLPTSGFRFLSIMYT